MYIKYMKVILTADIHNGYGQDGRAIWSMKVIREYAKNNNIEHIIVLGDLFDDRESLRIDTISEVSLFFKEAANTYNQGWTMFPGNHDMFLRNSWKINSLQFLENYVNLIQSVSKFVLDGKTFWVLPFIHHEDIYMKAVNELSNKATNDDILLTHVGVRGATMNQCFLLKNWNIVTFEKTNFKRVFTGHFHNHQTIGKVTYPGSPIAFRFDEGLVDHGFIVYDIQANSFEFIDTRKEAAKLGWEAPADFITIVDDTDLSNFTDIIKNNNVKVTLTKEYTQNELAKFREKLEGLNATKIVWCKQKEEEVAAQNIGIDTDQKKNILEVYYDADMPAEINKKLLLKLDDIISAEAEEVALSKEDLNVD